MQDSAKKPRLARGTFFQRPDESPLNNFEMEYSLKAFTDDLVQAHLKIGIKRKTPIIYCTQIMGEYTNRCARRSGILSADTQFLIASTLNKTDSIRQDPRFKNSGAQILKQTLHTFWLAIILPDAIRQQVLTNFISLLYIGKPINTVNEKYTFASFFQDCQALEAKKHDHIEFFYDCLQSFNSTLTIYEKRTLTINAESEGLLKNESDKNFYFIKDYSMLLMGITDMKIRREALQKILEEYCDELEGRKIHIL